MVRNTYSRTNHKLQDAYKHRSSVYVKRVRMNTYRTSSVHQAKHLANVVTTVPVFTEPMIEEEQFRLPPKQPVPDVVLRSDILPAQRSRVSL